MDTTTGEVLKVAEELSSSIDYQSKEVAIILAAGHGKRIKSHRSKMLHSIWGVPTVERVYNSCVTGAHGNTIIVVGIKAVDVMNVIGKREKNAFAFQEVQKGTGHAVQVALDKLDKEKFDGIVYVLPGDMGLIDAESVSEFRQNFKNSGSDMMVLTGVYEGPVEENNYGRIIRVKEKDIKGKSSGQDSGKVIGIMEYKDILAISADKPYEVTYNGRTYQFTKDELISNREYNSGVYAFKFKQLMELVYLLSSENAQNEVYITDLIYAFNKASYSVGAASPSKPYVVMGFNDKSVLKDMENIFRQHVYDSLKNLIEIDDPEDFFIEEDVVKQIIDQDKKGVPLDIRVGRGVHIGKGVRLNYNLHLKKNVYVQGGVVFGKNVTVGENTHLSTYPEQTMEIRDNVQIYSGDMIKGNVILEENVIIESGVIMTGSDEFPIRIGKNVLIKGTTYIFGSVIEEDVFIEHSIIVKKKIHKIVKKNGEIQKIRFYNPMPAGVDCIESLENL